MQVVEIDLPSGTTLKLAESTTGTEEPRLISVSNITHTISRERGTENSTCTIRCENVSGFFTTLMQSEDRYLKGQPLRVYDDGILVFSGVISTFPRPAPGEFTIQASLKHFFGRRVNKKIKRSLFPVVPQDNEGKFGNYLFGTAAADDGNLTAYRVTTNKYLAAWHHLYALIAVYDSTKSDITASCTLHNDVRDGYAYIVYESSDNEIYFNATGYYMTLGSVVNGDMENWLTPSDLADWWESAATGGSSVNRDNTPYTGNYCCRLDIDTNNTAAYITAPYVDLTPNNTYSIYYYYKNSDPGKTAAWRLSDMADNVFLDDAGTWQTTATYNVLPNATAWQKFELPFTAHPNYTQYKLLLMRWFAEDSSIYFDTVDIEERTPIENPADMLNTIITARALFQVDPVSLDAARAIYDERGYRGACIALTTDIRWDEFLARFSENFDCYRYSNVAGQLSLIVLDWGRQQADYTLPSIQVDWEQFTWWLDMETIISEMTRMWNYHYRKNYFSRLPEDISTNTEWQGTTGKIDLRFHTDDATAKDVASRKIFFEGEAQYMYAFTVPPGPGQEINPGHVVLIEDMRDGPFQGQSRLVLILRKTYRGDMYDFEGIDISKINDGIIILRATGDPDIAKLSDPGTHKLL